MSSWWVKDDTTDTKRTKTDGPRGAEKSVNEIAGQKEEGKIAKGHIDVTIR